MTAAKYETQEILNNWNVYDEQSKADFIDALYEFYGIDNGCYTGLFQRFQADISEFCRHAVTQRGLSIADLFKLGLEL